MRPIIYPLILLSMSACAYPTSSIVQGSDPSGVFVVGAPKQAELLIDGRSFGDALKFDGKVQIATVEPGQHQVVVRDGSGTYYDKPVYVGVGSHVRIQVN